MKTITPYPSEISPKGKWQMLVGRHWRVPRCRESVDGVSKQASDVLLSLRLESCFVKDLTDVGRGFLSKRAGWWRRASLVRHGRRFGQRLARIPHS